MSAKRYKHKVLGETVHNDLSSVLSLLARLGVNLIHDSLLVQLQIQSAAENYTRLVNEADPD